MTSPITATVVVEGDPPLLAGYRARVNALLDAEPSGPYRELHAAGRLDYRLKASGVPYPPFVAASAEFPELTVRVEWQNPVGGIGGSATIRAGKLVEQATASATEAGRALEVRAERDGTIALALATRRRRAGEWLGYAVTAQQHAFFRVSGGATVLEAADGAEPEWAERWTVRGDTAAYTALDPREPLDDALAEALERLAHDFADEWLWFDAAPVEETAIERQRYADYG
ncbi:MAG TPA: hypothetical protein VFN70_13315, partial [Burkholderiales bacterium]|nr:hypothetical protein [Burkholderiales bacterium]